MSTNRSFDRIAEAWLAEGPNELADRVLDAALQQVHSTKQRRRLPASRRTLPMNILTRLAASIAMVTIVGLGALMFVAPGVGPGASPIPASSPSDGATSSTALGSTDTSDWIVYTSERYGFDIKRHPTFREDPATKTWDESYAGSTLNAGGTLETFTYDAGPARYFVVNAWSVQVAPGVSPAEWLATWCRIPADLCEGGAFSSLDRSFRLITADGHIGVGQAKEDAALGLVPVGDRLYIVAAWGHFADLEVPGFASSRRVLEAIVSTMTLRPGGPVPVASPRP